MTVIPKTVGGVSIYIFLSFVLILVLFLDNYKWINFSNYLTKGATAKK